MNNLFGDRGRFGSWHRFAGFPWVRPPNSRQSQEQNRCHEPFAGRRWHCVSSFRFL